MWFARTDGRSAWCSGARTCWYCFNGCCCGRTERGYAAVPADSYKTEWIGRKLRQAVHLTKAGCLGPCALANVASLVFDGRAVWFHSVNTPWHVRLIFDYIETMIRADRYLAPPADLTEYVFNFYDWEARPHAPSGPAPAAPRDAAAIAILSHADTDLLTLERAREQLPAGLDVIGISLGAIRTDDQMDLVIEGDLSRAGIVVLRVHGELTAVAGYERLRQECERRGQHLVIVSGTGELSTELVRAGTATADVNEAVTTYLMLGGPGNIAACARFLSDRLLLTGHGCDPPASVPEHGIYLPDIESPTWEDWTRSSDPGRPTVAVLFYRAHLLSGNTSFVDALIDALDAHGLNALPVFTAGLRALDHGVPAALRLVEGHVDAVVSTLSFALGEVNAGEVTLPGDRQSVFERLDVPFVQVVASGMPRGAWEVSRRGLTPLETAINVALPEFDGRIISIPVSFKERFDGRAGGGAVSYVPHLERMDRVAGIAARLVRLRRTPQQTKRIAFVLTNSGAKASQVGNAVGLDAPASLLNLLHAMVRRGYTLTGLPESSEALMAQLARARHLRRHPSTRSGARHIFPSGRLPQGVQCLT